MNDKPNTDLTAEATAKGIAQLVHRPNECPNCGLAHGTHTYNCPRAAVPAVSEALVEEPNPAPSSAGTPAENEPTHWLDRVRAKWPGDKNDPAETARLLAIGDEYSSPAPSPARAAEADDEQRIARIESLLGRYQPSGRFGDYWQADHPVARADVEWLIAKLRAARTPSEASSAPRENGR